MKTEKSLRLNVILNGILTLSNVLFPLITTPYLSRTLLVANNGRIAFATSVINYFILFASLGIPTYGIRACAKNRNNRLALSKTVHELLIINIISTILCTIAFLLTVFLIPKFLLEYKLLLITGVLLLLNCIGMNWCYSALEEYRYIAVRSLVFKGISLVLIFLMVQNPADYLVYAVINVFSIGGSNLLNFIHSRKFVSYQKLAPYNLRQHLKPMVTFFAASAAISIYTNLDVLMLGFMRGDVDVGYFNTALKIRQAVAALATSINVVLLPRLAYYASNNNHAGLLELWKKSLRFCFAIALPATVFFIFYAEKSVLLLSGPFFREAMYPLQFLMGTVLLAALSGVTGTQMLVPLGKEKILLYSIVAGACADFFLNLYLIPLYASTGAAIATLCAEFIVLAIQCVYQRKKLLALIDFSSIVKEIVAGSVACLVVFFVNPLLPSSLFLSIGMAAGCFFLSYLVALFVLKDPLASELVGAVKPKHK